MKQVLTKSILENTIIFLLHQKWLNEIFLIIVNYILLLIFKTWVFIII